jgi:transposase-like protein
MTDACEPDSPKPTAHWPTIEADYRAGIKSVRQIAREHGLSEAAIRKRAKGEGWTRDLSAAIQAKADELVRNEAVRTEVRNANRIPDAVVVDANANAVYRVQMAHRAGLTKLAELRDTLLTELVA